MVYLDNYLETRNERLAGRHRPKAPRLKGERRRHVVDEVIDLLKDWRFSKFENEGSVRHGLRAAMCLDGHRWPLADIEADLVVQEGLDRIGAKRPSWTEGQRDYADPHHNCAWCGQDLPEEMISGARQGRFCSSVCAKSAIQKRTEEERFHASRTGKAACRIIRRDKLPLRDCLQCGTPFRPFNYQKADQSFCTHECSQLWRRRIPERDCRTCGTTFRPRHAGGIFCSISCSIERPHEEKPCRACGGPVPRGSRNAPYCSNACSYREDQGRRRIARKQRACEKVCAYCEETFTAKTQAATFCSANCRASAHYHQKKRSPQVIYLTAEVFDGWFKRAA
jgi:predicted nucleic acid-binding Zn ribbon protein